MKLLESNEYFLMYVFAKGGAAFEKSCFIHESLSRILTQKYVYFMNKSSMRFFKNIYRNRFSSMFPS